MDTYKLEDLRAGSQFDAVAKKAQEFAIEKKGVVEFNFNTIICLVDSETNLEWLMRDFQHAHGMEWKTVGPDCKESYDDETLAEIERRDTKAKEESQLAQEEYDIKCNLERDTVNKKIENVEFEIIDQKVWDDWKAAQKDDTGYGTAIFEYAENWAKLMQLEMSNGKTLAECARSTSHEADFLGITGFMHGSALQLLEKNWKHGEGLREAQK